METESALIKMFNHVWPHLGERERRLVAASEARRIGRCGVSMVSRACGLSRVTITKGLRELDEAPLEPGKTRRPGAGRPRVERLDPGLWSSLNEALRETTLEETEPALLWTNKSTRQIARELTIGRHPISHEKVAQILRKQGFRLQGTRQAEENGGSQSRQEQFRKVNSQVRALVDQGEPVFFLETQKKDGAWLCRERDQGECARGAEAMAPDWPDQLLAGDYPAGVFDQRLARDCVNVETAYPDLALVVDSILGWWEIDGQKIFPQATRLAIIAEIPGATVLANWLKELKRLAAYSGLTVELLRFPPGTSKWNLPATKLFSFVSSQWLGGLAKDHETSARLIGHHGDEVRAMALGLRLDHSRYHPPASDSQGEAQSAFESSWNFTLEPGYAQSSQEAEGLAAAI
ncbi:MAG: ISAzo13 family transposase [Deltaproteobacteria bacterium]|nr:ISAzo13 family transposase [Deltaproteobacteria bacterium]